MDHSIITFPALTGSLNEKQLRYRRLYTQVELD
jgi:hypothetical protein